MMFYCKEHIFYFLLYKQRNLTTHFGELSKNLGSSSQPIEVIEIASHSVYTGHFLEMVAMENLKLGRC